MNSGGFKMKKLIISLLLISVTVYCEETAEDYFNRGLDFANKGKYDEAIANLKKALELSPKYAELHFNLGIVYANKKEYDNAIKELEDAININPDNIYSHYVLAMLYEKKKLNDRATEEWEKVLKLNPTKELKEVAEKHLKRLRR